MKLRNLIDCGVFFIGFICVLLARPSYAEARTSEIPISRSQVSQMSEDEMQKDADRWGLSLDEWQKYLEIKKGPRGFWSPELDPIGMLAVEAKTPDEMRHYSRLYAQMQQARISAELAADRMRREEVIRINQGIPTFDQLVLAKMKESAGGSLFSKKRSPLLTPQDDLKPGDRLLLFVDKEVKPVDLVRRISTKVQNVAGINWDIYIKGAKLDKEVVDWAMAVSVPQDLVSGRVITLNHEKGMLEKLSVDNSGAQLFLKRGGEFFRVKESVF